MTYDALVGRIAAALRWCVRLGSLTAALLAAGYLLMWLATEEGHYFGMFVICLLYALAFQSHYLYIKYRPKLIERLARFTPRATGDPDA